MTAEEYIAQYGAALTDAEKRYILAFGPPNVPTGEPSRRPETAAQTVGSSPALELSDEERAREAQLRHSEDVFARMRQAHPSEAAHDATERGSYYARDTLTGSSDERSANG